MEHINCIFCDIPDGRVVIEENSFQGRQCARCGLIYISPRPSRDDIRNLYAHDQAHLSAQIQRTADISKRLHARHTLGIIAVHNGRGDLLEIGAGPGFFLEEARKRGHTPSAIEFNAVQAAFIRDNLKFPCEEATITEAFTGQTFDVIYHCDVMSHFFDPIVEFQAMHAKLRNNGLLVFETGNFADADPACFRHLQRFQYPDHLFFFGENHIRILLEKTGFECLRIYRYSIMPQLFLGNLLIKTNHLRKRLCGGIQTDTNDNPLSSAQSSKTVPPLKKCWRRIYAHLDYLLRYKLGAIAPRQKRLQTLIVVARKS